MKCSIDVHSLDLLQDPMFTTKTRAHGVLGIRLHIMEKRAPHFDYSIGYKGATGVIDFIIPRITVPNEIVQRIEFFFPLPDEKQALVILKGCHDPRFLFETGGTFDDTKHGISWEQIYRGPVSLTKLNNYSWELELENGAVYKIWKPNFADFRVVPKKAFIKFKERNTDGCE